MGWGGAAAMVRMRPSQLEGQICKWEATADRLHHLVETSEVNSTSCKRRSLVARLLFIYFISHSALMCGPQ